MDTRSTQSTGAKPAQSVVPEKDVRSDVRSDLRNAVRNAADAPRKSSGYGMPCANCRLYYPANLDCCPACNSRERVSTNVVPATPKTQAAAEPQPDTAIVEQEREAFLKEFKSQLFAAHAEVASASAICTLGEHPQGAEAASICKPCYDRLQERVDVFEAALHIDLKEAAQIIYDAVWADPSDPSKTYTNAASALLSELRKRSGVSSLLGPFQPLGN
ncbi:MAG TPA: hypothetical protein VN310_11120 [Candidatus Dormibacteraeota bacterium]|jgi:hypothetical protein|nr:hypothetical protein [Candidatus Dormibacteraeota bacterium]